MQADLTTRGAEILKLKKAGKDIDPEPLIGRAVTEDELWACTTCMACQEHCPVGIEHVQKIVDLRRSKVMMDSQFPAELTATFRGLENNYPPMLSPPKGIKFIAVLGGGSGRRMDAGKNKIFLPLNGKEIILEVKMIHSDILNEDRKIYISMPVP